MRTVFTILAIVLGLVVVLAVYQTSQAPRPAPGTPATQQAAPSEDADATDAPAEPAPEPDAPAPATAPAPAAADLPALDGLHPLPPTDPDLAGKVTELGAADPDSPYKMQARLTAWGAAVLQVKLADYRAQVTSDDRYVILKPLSAGDYTLYPYAARAVTINGQTVDLQRAAWTLADTTDAPEGQSATYRLVIADANDAPVLELVRRYELRENSYDLTLRQRAINRSGQPLRIMWQQNIQGDLDFDRASYLGDRRMFVSGYFAPWDAQRVNTYTDDAFAPRADVIELGDIWPNPELDPGAELVWLASENRYFTVVTHPVVGADVQRTAEIPPLEARFPQVGLTVLPDQGRSEAIKDVDRAVVFTLGSEPIDLAPAGEANLDLGIYAGPREAEVFEQRTYALLHFDNLIRYELGCTLCTFQWLAKGLLGFLKGIEYVVRDWGVAIIVLVLVVRLILHPITKKAQVNMMKMGKQMQTLQPEMEKLKKKYKDDQQRLNQEMMKLYREKGVNPANALGCLPMFLQTPIWIALYAMLYFAIELRHEPAFYGVFQWIGDLFGVYWPFLADLSSADHFIKFPGEGFRLNLIFVHPTFSGINILPLLMAVVFYIQQKFTTPPPANEQAAQQQKMMRFMVLLFPVFLYSAPSGLTLYILASTAAGVLDSYIVRKHVREQEEAGTLFEKKPRKPGGFMDRLAKQLEEKQRQLQQQQPGNKPARKGKKR